jgi:2-C-methyl-D-erythritol 2,4-cyclodiphosphate synthase
MRVGIGYDSHRLVDGRKLILAGVEIPHPQGLLGHSDADAVLHAIGDAILGAIGERDLGMYFPDNDPENKDMPSTVFLEKIYALIRNKGFMINNVDVTVLLEKPKLAAHISEMRKNIGAVLDLSEASIGIKAKTNEGMGFVGLGEGIAVFAVVTVKENTAHGNE